MEIQTGLEVGQRTQLVMTQRMQQSLRVLQAPSAELAELLNEALSTNPFLEEDGEDAGVGEDVGSGEDAGSGDPEGQAEDEPRDLATAPWGREVRTWEMRPAVARESWRAPLLRQVRLQPGGERDARIAEYLLGCVDARGYLAIPPEEIARCLGVPVARVEEVRGRVLHLEPAGLAARDLSECLRAQLAVRGEEGGLAWRLVAKGLPDVARRRFRRLAERLGVTEEEVRAAAQRIRELWPHPRLLTERSPIQPIYPDLLVVRVEDSYEVLLNDRIVPRLRLCPPHAALLRRADAAVSAFVGERMARARWLLGSLDARRRTLVGLMRLIVTEQRGFLERGVRSLRPLTYRQLADRMGLHESTVARAVRGKYVQTPRGVFPLRFFFSKGLRTLWGEACSPVGIRARVRELIAAEDRAVPLGDERLASILRREGVRISRRTVAKYRDQMRIPKASYRREP